MFIIVLLFNKIVLILFVLYKKTAFCLYVFIFSEIKQNDTNLHLNNIEFLPRLTQNAFLFFLPVDCSCPNMLFHSAEAFAIL